MVRELAPIDVPDASDLLRLAEEVRDTRRPRALRHNGKEIAVLMPPRASRAAAKRQGRDERPVSRRVRRDLALVERGAGMLRRYAPTPSLTVEQEREAFERGVAAAGATRRRRTRTPSEADLAAFRAAAGSWRDHIGPATFKRELRELQRDDTPPRAL